MRVWVFPEKTYEELGAERWEVEWYEVPDNWALLSEDEKDCFDHADFPCFSRSFRGLGAERKARQFAKKQSEHRANVFGAATVTRQVVDWYVEEDRVAEWSNVGETEYVP